MADNRDPVSAHNPLFEADEIQESDTEDGNDVGQVPESEIPSRSVKKNDGLYPMREEMMKQKDIDTIGNIGKLKTVLELKTCTNAADEEQAEAPDPETKVADHLEPTPAEPEVSQDSDTEDGYYNIGQATELEITSISSNQENTDQATDRLYMPKGVFPEILTAASDIEISNTADKEKAEAADIKAMSDILESISVELEISQDSDTEDEYYDVGQATATELVITSISSDEEDAEEGTDMYSLSPMHEELVHEDNAFPDDKLNTNSEFKTGNTVDKEKTEATQSEEVLDHLGPIPAEPEVSQDSDTKGGYYNNRGQATELTLMSSNQEDAEEATDILSPMRKELMLKGTAYPDKVENVGKLKTVEFKTGTNAAYEEKAEAAEIKVADLLGSTPAVLEVSQNQAPEVHEETPTQENGHDHFIEPMQGELSQQPTVCLNQNQQNEADTIILLDGSESEEEDPREKIMPEEVRQKVSSVVPALLNVVEDDKIRCCGCNYDCTTNCLNICCLPCNNPFKKQQSQDPNAKEEKFQMFNKILQKGSEAGRVIFQEIIFPLIRPFTRDLIAISEFLLGLTGLILSIVSFALGNNAAYNILHLFLAALSTLLGFIDMIVSLKFSPAFKKVIKKLRHRCALPEPNRNKKTKKIEVPAFLKKIWDTGRMLISEAILYPLLVCDLIEFIVDKGYEVDEPTDVVNLILFIISSVSLIFYVYIVRLGVLIAMVIHLQKCRQLKPKQKKALNEWSAGNEVKTEKGDKLDPTVAKKARNFQIYFILHVMGQMAAQIMMIVAVSLKIADDNRNRSLDDQLHISNELWFMLVAGYIMPFLGILSFFVPTFYWVYEHENGLCLDILSLLNMPGINHVLFPDEEIKDACESIQKIATKLNDGNKLRESFEVLRNVDFCSKASYAFRNPFLVAACLAYSVIQLAFVVLAIVGIQNESLGTIFYYILSIIIGILANVYVFLVAALWMTVIVCTLVAIATVIVLIAGICFLCLACLLLGGSNSNRNKNYSYI